tara:strand:+ start:89 stop:292 length:204 start_codon:yes stop_codon:yes gene_type:complete
MNEKTDFKEWLFQKINKYNDKNRKDILDEYCDDIYGWLSKNDNLELKDNYESFKIKFYLFNYNKYGN